MDRRQYPQRGNLVAGIAVFAGQRQRRFRHGQRFPRAVQVRQGVGLAAPGAAAEIGLRERVAARFKLAEALQRAFMVADIERQVALVFERNGISARIWQQRERDERLGQQFAGGVALAQLAQRLGALHQAQADAHWPARQAREVKPALHPFERGVVGVQAGEGVADVCRNAGGAAQLAGFHRGLVRLGQQADRAAVVAGVEGGDAAEIVDPSAGGGVQLVGVSIKALVPATQGLAQVAEHGKQRRRRVEYIGAQGVARFARVKRAGHQFGVAAF